MNLTVQNASVARPIEFDRLQAVNRALALFWRQGYQATTLAELLQTMGIGRSSFYAAFTDKRTFFIECLDLWAARTLDLLQRARTERPPMDALQDFFERSFVGARGAKAHPDSAWAQAKTARMRYGVQWVLPQAQVHWARAGDAGLVLPG